ncbi:MAG: hypothetical protein SFT81_07275 [Candidatus Caenarcaniphilales bacterium]|nr:hypothetical protein [Candidatus Caenarcaniphilales bacterium]
MKSVFVLLITIAGLLVGCYGPHPNNPDPLNPTGRWLWYYSDQDPRAQGSLELKEGYGQIRGILVYGHKFKGKDLKIDRLEGKRIDKNHFVLTSQNRYTDRGGIEHRLENKLKATIDLSGKKMSIDQKTREYLTNESGGFSHQEYLSHWVAYRSVP